METAKNSNHWVFYIRHGEFWTQTLDLLTWWWCFCTNSTRGWITIKLTTILGEKIFFWTVSHPHRRVANPRLVGVFLQVCKCLLSRGRHLRLSFTWVFRWFLLLLVLGSMCINTSLEVFFQGRPGSSLNPQQVGLSNKSLHDLEDGLPVS